MLLAEFHHVGAITSGNNRELLGRVFFPCVVDTDYHRLSLDLRSTSYRDRLRENHQSSATIRRTDHWFAAATCRGLISLSNETQRTEHCYRSDGIPSTHAVPGDPARLAEATAPGLGAA